MEVRLNGRNYVVVPRRVRRNGRDIDVPVEEYDVELFTDSFDTQGGQSQERIGPYTSRIFPNFMLGFGRDRVASDSARNPDEYRRFFDSTCDTRFEKIYLPILEEDSVETAARVVKAYALFKGDIHSAWQGATADPTNFTYTGSTTTWTSKGAIRAVGGVATVVLDMIAHKTHLICHVANANDHLIERSTDGATWASATTPPTANLLTNNIVGNEDSDFGLLADVGGEAILVAWHEANGTITFFSSTDAGDVWVDEAVDIASGNGPQGTAVMPGIDNEDKLLVGTREGLWEVDTAPATWTFRLIFPMTPNNSNCRRMTVHSDGALWFSQGVDDDSPPTTYRMFTSEGQRRFEVVPNDLASGDGVVDDMLGPIRWMHSSEGFLYACIGGGKAGRNARIICHTGRGWHSMRRNGSANVKLENCFVSGDDDGTPRLHYSLRTAAATTTSHFLGQPNVNPASGVTISRESTGIIDLPYIDGGMPLISAAWLRFGINASALSADNSGEFIQMTYGLNAASRTTSPSSPFEFVSGTLTQDLPEASEGTSGIGEPARNIGTRVTLNRDSGSNSDTPELEDVEINYLKIPLTLEGYIFTVDVGRSTGKNEQVIKDLKTARDLPTLPILNYASSGNRFVKVRPPLRWFPEITERSASGAIAPDVLAQRGGYVDVRCEEII